MIKSDKRDENRRSKVALTMAKRLAKRLVRMSKGAEGREPSGPHMVSVVGGGGVEIEHRNPLLAGLVASGLQINHFCGGNGSCGTCKFEVVEGLSNLQRPTTAEIVSGAGSEPHRRLACQARIVGPITIRIKM